jgi:hypothetical protein
MQGFIDATQADEIMISMPIYAIDARLKSVEHFGKLRTELRKTHAA